MKPVSGDRSFRPRFGAFSLVEVLVVVGVLSILMVLSVSALRSGLNNHRLSGAGAQLASLLERARMHATTTQRVVAVRFYALDGVEAAGGYGSVQVFEIIPSSAATVPSPSALTRAYRFDKPILLSAVHSTALDQTKQPNLIQGSESVAGVVRSYREFYIFPDGSTSLAAQSPNPYFTLAAEADEEALRNPLVVSLDPVTSRATIFRR